MLGWHLSVYRQPDGGAAAASFGAKKGARLAVWQTGLGGLNWLDELVKQGKAVDLGGDGYPKEYTALAEHLLPALREGPPEARAHWVSGEGDVIGPGWEGKTVKDLAVMDACRPGEWLLVRVWDES